MKVKNLFKSFLTTVALIIIPSLAFCWSLAWDASTGTVEGYVVEISQDGGGSYPYIYVVTDGQRLALDDKCEFNTTYTFRVSAYNASGISEPCPAISWYRPPYEPPAENPLPLVNTGPVPPAPDNTNVGEN